MSAQEAKTELILAESVLNAPETVACPDCDLLQRLPPMAPGNRERCARCGRLLAIRPGVPADLPLALAWAAAMAYLVANLLPMMDLSVVGRFASTTIAGGALQMWREGQLLTAVLVLFCAVLAPGVYILFTVTLLLALRRTPPPSWVGEMLRWTSHLQVWSMGEVMMLGVLVALVKIAELATVTPGMGMFAFGAVILLLPAISLTFDVRAAWARVAWVDSEAQRLALAAGQPAERR
jgi:paraquat-inducible protein A